ncbi:hypothetical protein [Pseudobacteriovorax antillogorgiicola]|uniref:Alpha/beta hydrolase family protein n=1 Tax=Pseudobacteriovorax antillogorgiicola TaxID=1513793 RepID=A0A1Y6BB95_9BACT|nr:hypothetical protein [Pseudobacteriovorax antillogorgiicola]TCS58828.1 hypothetical protein EDD56_102343 [Pseudobacteriovorax antillogorgiicola]SME94219.1 hypothetical protein SAMN06296036_102100 [Pseudobacteriovorax antillogorgiicola]
MRLFVLFFAVLMSQYSLSEEFAEHPVDISPQALRASYATDQSGFRIALENNVFYKATANAVTEFFDPSRPTLVYFHGWRLNNRDRGETVNFNHVLLPENAVNMWRRAGWNVVYYNWIQYADDQNFLRAECRIWSATCSNRNITWLDAEGKLNYLDEPESLSARIADEWMAAFGTRLDMNQELRFLGHSLGTQLAIAVADELLKNYDVAIDRLALTDLTSSVIGKRFLNGEWVGRRAFEIAEDLIQAGTAIENYRCWQVSRTFPLDQNIPFDQLVLTIERKLDFTAGGLIDFSAQDAQHRACFLTYFWSIEQGPSDDNLETFTGASVGTDVVRANHGRLLKQISGESSQTENPNDDQYEIAN